MGATTLFAAVVTNLITAYQHNYIPERFDDYFRRYAGVRKALRMLATRITGQAARTAPGRHFAGLVIAETKSIWSHSYGE